MSIQVGDLLPGFDLQEGTSDTTHNTTELFAGKKVIIFAVPGAFGPGCSTVHLPGYLADADALAAKGVDLIACISVNDAFVMSAWGKAQGVDGKILMLADPDASYTKAIGLDVDAGRLGGIRSKRYSMLVEDRMVTKLNIEPDSFGISCSTAVSILETL